MLYGLKWNDVNDESFEYVIDPASNDNRIWCRHTTNGIWGSWTSSHVRLADNVIDGAITTAKLADVAVTNAKIASGIDGAKITNGTITVNKLAGGGSSVVDIIAAKASKLNTARDFIIPESVVETIRSEKHGYLHLHVNFDGSQDVSFDFVSTCNGTCAGTCEGSCSGTCSGSCSGSCEEYCKDWCGGGVMT